MYSDFFFFFFFNSGFLIIFEQFLSLVNSEAAFNCEVIRDCYEAFALYCFERYLIACLGNAYITVKTFRVPEYVLYGFK